MIIENKKNIKNLSQAPSSLTLNPRKSKLPNKNQGMLSKYELSVPKENNIYNLKNQNEMEKEESGYELDQSYDNNANILKDNKNLLSSFTNNDKSNGENIDNMIKYDSYSYKNINKTKKKMTNYSDYGISSYNSVCNKNGYIDYNMNNEEIVNEWINSKIKCDGVSTIASNKDSTDKNQSEFVNNFLKNNINNKNNSSNISKELKKENNNNFKNFIKINKNSNLNDLIDENNNFISDNKTIKKSIILQQVLVNEMKKEIESLKIEKENMQKKYNSEKENIMNEYNKTINSILQENKKLNEIIKNQKNEIKNINKICREKIIELEQVNKMMESIKIDNGKNKNSTTENDNFDISNIKEENSKNTIKEKNLIKIIKNQNIIKGKDLYERKTKESNNSTRDNNNEFIEEKLLSAIDNSYDTIKQVSNNLKFFSDKLDDNSEIVIEKLKNIIEKININNNGYTDRNENISIINDKIKTINEFNNIIKLEVNELIEYFKNNIINYKISSNNKIDKNINHNINNLIRSENGQNYFNEVKTKKYYTNNNLFKKIDIKRNKYKTNRILNELSDDNFSYSKKRFIKYNTKNKIINKSKDEIIFNKNDMFYNRTISLKNNLLEKNSVVYKSNVSPMSKEYYLNSSNNNENDKFDVNLNNLINKIIKNNGDENRSENSFNKLKNIKLSSKVKEISDLINDNKTSKNNITSFEEKNYKKLKIPIPEDGKINTTLNIFPTFNKIKENKLSISNNNSHRNKLSGKSLRPIYKNSSEYFSVNNCNPFASIPLISNCKTINHKKNTSMSSNYISKKNDRNKYSELESIKTETRIIDNYMKMSNLFKSLNNSYLSSNTIESQMSKTKTETTPNRISNNSFSSLGNRNVYVRIDNDENKLLSKIFFNKEKFKNNNYDLNGVTNDFMRPSFLKSNAVLSLNNNKSEKRREKTLYNIYKK